MDASKKILITGGIKCGKSRYALERAEEIAGDPLVTVGIAAHSLHGATPEGIQAAAAYAAEAGQPFQIHIAEEQHDLDYARRNYGTSPGRVLRELGVVSENLCIVHGVWLDAEEIAAFGEAGAKCAYNPISLFRIDYYARVSIAF